MTLNAIVTSDPRYLCSSRASYLLILCLHYIFYFFAYFSQHVLRTVPNTRKRYRQSSVYDIFVFDFR